MKREKFIMELEKEGKTRAKVSRREEITKIRAEINEIKMRNTIEKTQKTKNWIILG